MNTNYILAVVSNLNAEIYEQIEDDYIQLEYMTNTCAEAIEFLGVVIWNSEDDCREWIEVMGKEIQEDLEFYLRKEINKILEKLNKIKLLENK